jgi:hypothetical protein
MLRSAFMTDHSDERRAIIRIHATWLRLAKNRFPSQSEIDPKEFGADWSSCLFMKIDSANAEPRASFSGRGLDEKSISRPLAETLLALAQGHVSRVLATGKPLGYGGTAAHEGKDILYRIVLLPLSEDGAKIDALLAGMTYRDIPVASELRVSDIAWCKSPLTQGRPRDVLS